MSLEDLPAALRGPIDVLMIDNFDSFTWNLYQSLSLLGADVVVIRNDAIPATALPLLDVRRLIISPGPGHPKTDSGISRDAIKWFAGKVPVLGVCMGLECVVDVYGGEIAYAGEIKHGKLSPVRHDGRGIFSGLPQGFMSTRYHSLSASVKTLPADELSVSAVTQESGVIMAVRHRKHTVEAVQYHPESVLSEQGQEMLANFLGLRGGTWDENRHVRAGEDLNLPPFSLDDVPSLPNGAEGAPKQHQQVDGAGSKLPTILEKIHAQRLNDIDLAKRTPGTTPDDLETLLDMHLVPPLISFVDRLRAGASPSHPALMAEVKRASPSKGPIALSTNAAVQARQYALAGAAVISVLTEPTWFRGLLSDMAAARQAVGQLPYRPAILRKDFIVDEYQIAEARVHGADTILLIVALLPPARLLSLIKCARSYGMEPLVEVNSSKEMEAALEMGAKVIGVNNRDLRNFEVDMGTTSRLAEMLKGKDGEEGEIILCALSGITGGAEVRNYVQQGVKAVLVGEALMRAKDTKAFVRDLLGNLPSSAAPSISKPVNQKPLVKICGIRTPEEAQGAFEAGADFLGLVFAAKSKRKVSIEQACAISNRVTRLRIAFESSGSSTGGAETCNEGWFTLHARRLTRSLGEGRRPLLVGVFQDQPLEYIREVVSLCRLDLVQMHGNESLDWTKWIDVPVIKAFHAQASSSDSEERTGLEDLALPGYHHVALLDSVVEGTKLSGGSGKVVDWDMARAVVREGETPKQRRCSSKSSVPQTNGANGMNGVAGGITPMPVILAGGLSPENVREAVERVHPWAVDVSGGVENSDGTGKDLKKVAAFIQAVKQIGDPSPPPSATESK
ncbi:N-anthranilate isomerase [Schizopora paradoxa]|uniref:Multifunctional tryptophan biosynthesis protein n=1 Tax=Schizopora paradoxa TaxID=27342 RepID=A0A0H2RP54_9AGAM|nr:N-anthranilate isomerase [Schizopora paradoxa]